MRTGFRFVLQDHLLDDCQTRLDVVVYSERVPPVSTNYETVVLPDDIATLFDKNRSLHTVLTNQIGKIVEQNNHVR